MKETAILIPARYNSSRFPGKMLFEFDGIPLVRRVYDVCAATGIDTYVLTDDERIAGVVPNSIMTSTECENGTARCASAVEALNYANFINVQGDMIDINETMIRTVERNLSPHGYPIGFVTLYTHMNEADRSDSNVVKMIHTKNMAHWFCRASLKYGSRHLGVYGYDRKSLLSYLGLTSTPEEQAESLEQLRWLQTGGYIHAYEVDFDGIEINTREDADLWIARNKQKETTHDIGRKSEAMPGISRKKRLMTSEENQRRYDHG